MADHYRDNVLHGSEHDTYASSTRWRHQESSSFARHARPRAPDGRDGSQDLTVFLNSSRVDAPPQTSGSTGPRHAPLSAGDDIAHGPATVSGEDAVMTELPSVGQGILEVKCGPLLNYRRMENETWYGSVLIVTKGGGLFERPPPVLVITASPANIGSSGHAPAIDGPGQEAASNEPYAAFNGNSSFHDPARPGTSNEAPNGTSSTEDTKITATKLYSDPNNTFWRFDLIVPLLDVEIRCDYSIPGLSFPDSKKTDKNSFYIPAISDSMRIMFHSCNGFSVGTDEDAWSGAALWNDVQRFHKTTPFHVMLGGGDQIYNDGIRVYGPLREWTDIGNPMKRQKYPFPEEMRRRCDDYYVNNYIRWYGTEPFATANGQIPQLNLWDDHDIIDGFGSYTDEFMRCSVFRGIGGVANKYYLLFQHHLAPPATSFTTADKPQRKQLGLAPTRSRESEEPRPTTASTNATSGPDARQLENTYVLQEKEIDSSYIIGAKPGPYVVDHSRSIYARLGARIAFFGIDARTERTRHQVNYPETYDIIFSRLRKELGAAKNSSSPIHHLIVLLGIPIAYPRLTWLENIFSSPLLGPLKFLNKRFGFGGGFFNHFDGNVDLLDDLDDHYTARTHKKERLFLVQQLQALASEFSVRISILGGDVHLAAMGRFYSNPKLNIPVSNDHRYMANVVSSAIVNKPPPQAVANLLARRNKIHHLDHDTDETLIKLFDKDPGKTCKTSSSNHVTMPSRNWAQITENKALEGHNGTNGHVNGNGVNGTGEAQPKTLPHTKNGHEWIHAGEVDAGTTHKAANATHHGRDHDGSLHVCIHVEKDQHDASGQTQGYGVSIPKLIYTGAANLHVKAHAPELVDAHHDNSK
ncbi:hypothetical protein B0O99DRAFT_631791 [Bisporella sp. PMI_857]|nr:hypothetical protein B0O99DRAFT_631791 [Bisporella sp. PMI_857]